MRGRPGACVPFLLVSLLAVSPASGTTVHGATFAPRLDVGAERPLALCAAELLRYKRVFRGYVAALYYEDCDLRNEPLADVPRRLELSYFWSIPGDKFGPAGEAVLEKSLSSAELAPLRERLAAIGAAYRNVEPDDRYALTYVPGVGTELSLNGDPLIVIPGADFARAYFSIWLGDEPLDDGLRERLLSSPAPVAAEAPGLGG